jgi:hypothetical protein
MDRMSGRLAAHAEDNRNRLCNEAEAEVRSTVLMIGGINEQNAEL